MQIVTHFKGELLWLSIGPPLLHDKAHGLQNEPKRIGGDPLHLHECFPWAPQWLQGRLSLCSSKRTLTTLQVETGELSSDLVSCRSVLRVINNLHGPVTWDCQLSSNLDTCRCVLCGIYHLHCPFLWDCELSSSLDPSRNVLCVI